jgi:hypothetical protein
MKPATLVFLIILSSNISPAQPLCDFLGKDSLTIQVAGDTIKIWDLAACGNCASRFATSVTLCFDTITIVQEDTSSQTALCDCLFNLCTSFVGATPGMYRAVIYRDWHRKFPSLPQPVLIGSILFEYAPHESPGFTFNSFQSNCISDAVARLQERLVGEFALLPNFPNPFNPSTTIWYQTCTTKFVEIKVYDPLGRVIQTLVADVELPGLHSIRFDASPGLSSGAYYVRLNAGAFSQARMMVLTR